MISYFFLKLDIQFSALFTLHIIVACVARVLGQEVAIQILIRELQTCPENDDMRVLKVLDVVDYKVDSRMLILAPIESKSGTFILLSVNVQRWKLELLEEMAHPKNQPESDISHLDPTP